MEPPKPLLAFYGATGGCVLASLAPALKAGYHCTALARTPDKLTTLLLAKGVSQSTLTAHLHITQGDVLSLPSVKAALSHNGHVAEIIISGIGISTLAEIRKPVTLCASAMGNILAALAEVNPARKPLLITLSSTGITRGRTPLDLPLLMVPFYHFLLANPHRDKIRMEQVVEEHMQSAGCQLSGFVMPRPALLTNGAAKGVKGVRAGMEEKPAVGYTIGRDDVGGWVFETLVMGKAEEWIGTKPTLAY